METIYPKLIGEYFLIHKQYVSFDTNKLAETSLKIDAK